MQPAPIHGHVAPGFEAVETEFRQNFAQRADVGAACAVYHKGIKVVDLWGGYRDAKTHAPWQENTLEIVFSTTKGMAAICLAMLNSRGLLDYDKKVVTYWPEFGQNGKENISVRQLISHQAGLVAVDSPLDLPTLADLDKMAVILARQKPLWEPGTHWGYHNISLGFYQNELLRRIDPQHRSLGRFFADEVAARLGIEFYIGLPPDVPLARIGTLVWDWHLLTDFITASRKEAQLLPTILDALNPHSLTRRAFQRKLPLLVADYKNPAFRGVEIASASGIGQARAIARAYGALAAGGAALGITPKTLEALKAPAVPPTQGEFDLIMRKDLKHSLGFGKPSVNTRFSTNPHAFGWPGLGGSLGFADPDAQIGFGYVMNRMSYSMTTDARALSLAGAVYRCIGAPQ